MSKNITDSFDSRYGVIIKALDKRNLKRWVIAWASIPSLFLMSFSIDLWPIVAFPLGTSTLVLWLNTRDINKTFDEIKMDIYKRFASSETKGEQ